MFSTIHSTEKKINYRIVIESYKNYSIAYELSTRYCKYRFLKSNYRKFLEQNFDFRNNNKIN